MYFLKVETNHDITLQLVIFYIYSFLINEIILIYSIILFPIQHFPSFVILLHILDPPVLWNYKSIPIIPIRILDLQISIFISISLLETYKLVQIRQHVDKNTALMLSLQKIINCKLYGVIRLEDIHHLAYYVLEIKI
jgi:hypothetical protein